MGRAPCCVNHKGQTRRAWTPEEDQKLIHYLQHHGLGNWSTLPKLAGLSRCGKSCRLRWTNYLRPDIKRGTFSIHENLIIIRLHAVLGNKWSAIASHLPGRTDNEIKNHWNSRLKKQLMFMGIDPVTHRLLPMDSFTESSSTFGSSIAAGWNTALIESELGQLAAREEYSWLPPSQIGKLSDTINNTAIGLPVLARPSSENSFLMPSVSMDQLRRPHTSRWLHGFQKQIKQDFDSRYTDPIEDNAFLQEALQFANLERISEGMPNMIQLSSEIPGNPINERDVFCDELPYDKENMYDDSRPSHRRGISEILENGIQYHPNDPFGSPISSEDLPAARADLLNKGNEYKYWDNLLNLTENGRP